MSERERVSQVYEGYAASAAKQRDWNADNPGNVAIRAELVSAAFELAGPTLRESREDPRHRVWVRVVARAARR